MSSSPRAGEPRVQAPCRRATATGRREGRGCVAKRTAAVRSAGEWARGNSTSIVVGLARIGEHRGVAAGLASLPERAGRPHRVALERLVGGAVHAREIGVQLVDAAAKLGKLALDFANEEGHVGRHVEAAAGREHCIIGESAVPRRFHVCDCASSTITRRHAGLVAASIVKVRRRRVR